MGDGGVTLFFDDGDLGWRPTCDCDPGSEGKESGVRPMSPLAPCVVLDPFAGSGTTLKVARRLGRHAVGIELRDDYCRLIRAGTRQQTLLGAV